MGNSSSTTQNFYNTEYVSNEYITIGEQKECRMYVPLDYTLTPDIPILKIRQAADKSDAEVILELTKYLKELREYIAKEKREQKAHYQNYIDACLSEVK
jgi:tRNA G37 N-methylase Trm5